MPIAQINRTNKSQPTKLYAMAMLARPILLGTLTAGSVLLFSAINTTPVSAYSNDKNWPCVQAKMEKMTAATIWPNMTIKETDHSWQNNKKVLGLINQIIQRRVPLEETDKIIAKFAADNSEDLTPLLEATFVGLLNETNKIRSEIIAGIGRLTKRQKGAVENITANRHKLAVYEKKDEDGSLTKEEDKEFTKLEKSIAWAQRIHKEREQSLEFVCEAPVILGQRLYALGKQLQKHNK